jgi:hypothetical protein
MENVIRVTMRSGESRVNQVAFLSIYRLIAEQDISVVGKTPRNCPMIGRLAVASTADNPQDEGGEKEAE